MKKQDYNIHIIGAGVSGLIAAKVLEDNGYCPVIIEATDSVGGRVKTDLVEGYQLDHGFQVLLTAYPAAQKYLDFNALDLQHFLPGAAIIDNGKINTIGDPLRNRSFLFSTLFSAIGEFSDKLKVLKLNKLLKKTTLAEIFQKEEKTTVQYLLDFGFSKKMISQFFNPFFSGIYLESELNTSSRMFEFVYKMFGEGYAALPKAGIEAIPRQLKNNLKNTSFKLNTKVNVVQNEKIILEDGQELESHFTIIATEPSSIVPNLKNQEIAWKSCDTLYYETDVKIIDKALIGLVTDENALINNIFYHTNIATTSVGEKQLISITVVKEHTLSDEALISTVKQELQNHCKIDSCRFLKHYKIPKALPKLESLQYEILPSETRLTDRIFLAGDVQLNGSLNAAMISGEKAAYGVIDTLENLIKV